MIRIKDIAERAGVSTTTVSNVIHNKPGKVSAPLENKIRKMISEMGYVPSLNARTLARERSGIIGVVMDYAPERVGQDRQVFLAAKLIGYLEEAIHDAGYFMMLSTRRSLEETLKESRAWNYDGIITYGLPQEELYALREAFGKPVVTLSGDLNEQYADIVRVATDDFGGGKQIGRYLLARGHRNLLFVSDHDEGVDHFRWLGFREAAAQGGLSNLDGMHLMVSTQREERLNQYRTLLPLLRQQTALCFSSDMLAVEAINCLEELEVQIPEELSVAGFDDMGCARISRPGLTAVCQCLDVEARSAVELLKNMVSGISSGERERKIATYVAERDSVRSV